MVCTSALCKCGGVVHGRCPCRTPRPPAYNQGFAEEAEEGEEEASGGAEAFGGGGSGGGGGDGDDAGTSPVSHTNDVDVTERSAHGTPAGASTSTPPAAADVNPTPVTVSSKPPPAKDVPLAANG